MPLSTKKLWYAKRNDMDNDIDVRQEAVTIISSVLGEKTASLYSKYYEDKSVKVILSSLDELLTEHMGQKKADEVTEAIYNKYRHIKT